MTDAEYKRGVIRRLKAYRDANGLGCLDKVAKASRTSGVRRITPTSLRMLLVGDVPTQPIEQWRKIERALDRLEEEAK